MWATVNYALIIIVLVILLIGWIVYGIKTKIMCQQEDGPGEQNLEMHDMSPTYASIEDDAVIANGGLPRLHHIDKTQNAPGGSSVVDNGHVEEPRDMGSSEREGLLSDSGGAGAILNREQSGFDETGNIPEGNSGGEYGPVQEHTHMLSPESMDFADSGGDGAISNSDQSGIDEQDETTFKKRHMDRVEDSNGRFEEHEDMASSIQENVLADYNVATNVEVETDAPASPFYPVQESQTDTEAQNKGTEPQNDEAYDPDYVLRPGVSK